MLQDKRDLDLNSGQVKKQSPKTLGPYSVKKVFADSGAYELELPKALEQIHPTAHVSSLNSYHENAKSGNIKKKVQRNESSRRRTSVLIRY